MKTLDEQFGRDAAYFGRRGDWLVVLTTNRDDDPLGQSNFRVATKALREVDAKSVHVERASHWGAGWVDFLVINPNSAIAVRRAGEILAEIENYPILDEEDYSSLQQKIMDANWRGLSMADRRDLLRQYDLPESLAKGRRAPDDLGIVDALGG